jgi:hypothetical protein
MINTGVPFHLNAQAAFFKDLDHGKIGAEHIGQKPFQMSLFCQADQQIQQLAGNPQILVGFVHNEGHLGPLAVRVHEIAGFGNDLTFLGPAR